MNRVLTKRRLDSFREMFNEGLTKIHEACKVYVEALDGKDKSAKAHFREAFPHIPEGVWARLEMIGRGQMIPELFADPSPMGDRIRRLPFSSQKQLYGKAMELVTDEGDVLKVSFHHATRKQARQLLARDHIRTPAEQRAWLKSQAPGKPRVPQHKVYEVKNGRLNVIEPHSFSRDLLFKIMGEM